MEVLQCVFLTVVLCHVVLIHQSEAMFGLCSTNWMSNDGCFDPHDECKKEHGRCHHDGDGDHGEACVCKRRVFRNGVFTLDIVTKSHFSPFIRRIQNAHRRNQVKR